MKQIKLIANALLGIAFCLAGTSCQTDAVSTPTVTSMNEALPVGSTRTTESLPFIKGADLSYTNELEDCGVQFTENGVAKTSYELMNSYGANLVRLRLWHNLRIPVDTRSLIPVISVHSISNLQYRRQS